MAKRLSALSVPGGLVTMNSEDIRNRKWTDAEKQAMRRASEARAAGLDLPEKEYEDIPRLTPDQLARMVRLREVRRKVPVSVRLDPQVLDWLRAKGDGHLTRINDILTDLMVVLIPRPIREAGRRVPTQVLVSRMKPLFSLEYGTRDSSRCARRPLAWPLYISKDAEMAGGCILLICGSLASLWRIYPCCRGRSSAFKADD